MIAAQELSEFLQMEIRLKFEEEVLEFYRNGEIKSAQSKKNPQSTFPVIKSTVGGSKVKLSQNKLGRKLCLPNSGVEVGKFPVKNLDWNIIGISGRTPSGPAKKADLNNDYKLILELVIACLECGSGDFEADDEDTAVYKPVFSKATEDQMAPTSEEIAVLETTAEDFPIFTETSPAFEMVLTETVQEKAASPPQEQNQEATEEEEFQRLIQSQVLEILTTPCEISNQTQLEILEKSAEIPEQSAIPEIMEKEVEVQRHSGKAEKESQMAEEEVSQTPIAIFEEPNEAEDSDSLSRYISNFALDEAEGESERTLKITDEEDVQEDAESLPLQLFQRTSSPHQVTNFHFHSSSTPTLPDEIPETWTKKVQGLIESALASQHASFRQEIELMEAKHTELIEKSEKKHSADLKEISKSVEKTLEIISLFSKTVSNTMEIYTSDSQLQFNEFNKVKEQIENVTIGLQKQMSLLQMDIRSALAIASANQVVTKDYLKVIIDNQKEAYKLFRLIGAHSRSRKMEQRNPENSAQHLSSSGLDGTEFIGAVADHFSDAAQTEERGENLRRIKELCGNMQGISEVAGSSKRKRN
ncbi:unnamed protein product [Cuscuta campestris]|uniref:Uncharacterized protein n=1 Tax=Cuscuta campestris TaxID=132261 RepID=A0A484LP01_9ASTE|nr:unnamed protein product [Cuscuta campestris]